LKARQPLILAAHLKQSATCYLLPATSVPVCSTH
jgi:hypothetical protein